jgi:SAM-dependent methyltransferase
LRFESSPQYWQDRYAQGGNSGSGSYGRLAKFKAEIVNKFVADRNIRTVIEFGSGDGAQLELAHYPAYIGVDISPRAIELCRSKFQNDPSKRFMLTSSQEAIDARAELAMSLDVIYHLVEDDIYHNYMVRLASASDKFICVYSSNIDRASKDSHVRHRMFTDWFEKNAPAWRVILKVANPFPENPETPGETSWADFYFLEKSASSH